MKSILLFLFICTHLYSFAQPPTFVTDSLDAYIQKGMRDWQIPGLAIVVVKDGKVAVMKGYGVRNITTKEPVNEQTLFMIASNTKLFTSTALALLEYKKAISLDDRITKYFPDYRLYDSTTTQLVTIKDLLSHRIGTKTFQGDFTFWNTGLSSEEIMQRMRLLRPSQQFRLDFGYCNSCFLTAGQVIPKVTGQPWYQYIQNNLLTPLGMNSTLALSTNAAQQPNIATPYTTSYTGTLQKVPYDDWNNLAPAASIISNVSDLSHWLQLQLDSGKYNGRQVVPFAVLQKTRDANTIISSRSSALYPMHFRAYGLGVFEGDYNGRQLFWHTGGAGGMVSNVSFVPEARLGIAILTNNDNQNFFEALRYQLLDAYLGVPYVNRSQQQLPQFEQDMQQQLTEIKGWKTRVKGNRPPLPLTAYAGSYSHSIYGSITIQPSGQQLKVDFGTKPDLSATLTYMDRGEWLLQYNNVEYGIFAVKFLIQNGKVAAITTRQNEFVEYDSYTFFKDR